MAAPLSVCPITAIRSGSEVASPTSDGRNFVDLAFLHRRATAHVLIIVVHGRVIFHRNAAASEQRAQRRSHLQGTTTIANSNSIST